MDQTQALAESALAATQPVMDATQPVLDAAQPVFDAAQPIVDAAQDVVTLPSGLAGSSSAVGQMVGPLPPLPADDAGGDQGQLGATGALGADLLGSFDAGGVLIVDTDVSTMVDPDLDASTMGGAGRRASGIAVDDRNSSTLAADGHRTTTAAAGRDPSSVAAAVRGASTLAERWPRLDARGLEGSLDSGASAPPSNNVPDEISAGFGLSEAFSSASLGEGDTGRFTSTGGPSATAIAAALRGLRSIGTATYTVNADPGHGQLATSGTLSAAFRPGILDRPPTPLGGLPAQSGPSRSQPRNAAAATAGVSLSTAGPPGSAPPSLASLRLVATWRALSRLASLRPPHICLSSLTPPG